MSELALSPISVQDLNVFANDRDLLQDLFTYLDYVREHQIKRMVRTNQLPKSDSLRIAKAMGDPELEQAVKETGGAAWIDFIDDLAFRMGLVSYDTEGKYVGYSSAEPSFIDNYVTIVEKAFQNFLDLEPARQEKKMLKALVADNRKRDYDITNEFYIQGVLGRLDSFDRWGAATGVMPSLDFAAIRTFLLDFLQRFEPGVWYSTAELVAYLKEKHPYFLIPENMKPDRWGHIDDRYSNFRDGEQIFQYNREHIPDDAPDAFERVEGRYVERFLEGIPLEIGFVEVAYDPAPYQGIKPMMGYLKAFRINERFLRIMRDEIQPPRVTLLPNFNLLVESELYPARLMQILDRLAERVSSAGGINASVITMRLKKECVAAERVRSPDLDVVETLRQITGRELPPNVAIELEEWSGHAEQFTLYQGFSLLESAEPLPEAEAFIAERIAPNLSLVRRPEALVNKLEETLRSPIWVKHPGAQIQPLPEGVKTVFPKKTNTEPEPPTGLEPLLIGRSTLITLQFPTAQSFDDFRRALAEARCPIQTDAALNTIRFPAQYQALFETVLQQLSEKYQTVVQDLGS